MPAFFVLLLGILIVIGEEQRPWGNYDFPTWNGQNRRVDQDFNFNNEKMPINPSSQLYPVLVVSPGKWVTIHCNNTFKIQGSIHLKKDGRFTNHHQFNSRGHPVSFPFIVNHDDGGLYQCCYGQGHFLCRVGEGLELVIRDSRLLRPQVSFGSIPVRIGDVFTVHCRVQINAEKFYFQKDGKEVPHQTPSKNELTIQGASEEHVGNYSCSYSWQFLMSKPSDSMLLLITGADLSQPTISSDASGPVARGAQISITCETKMPPVIFYLHINENPPKRIMDSNEIKSKYYFKNFSETDQGSYSCSCARQEKPFLVSERSHTLNLLLLDEESNKTGHTVLIAIGVCVILFIPFLLLILFWFKRRRDALLEETQTSGERSFRVLRIHRATKHSGTSKSGRKHLEKEPPKDDPATQPQNIVYAELKRYTSDRPQAEAETEDDVIYTTIVAS
ncbi:leukocyte immunoglobulin-like receptor subfamily B member 4A [Anolis sagrei]|uniref:leukocyte immunoglobulin-like receptor subfamily B member 4A n=1 Tax=Anolis sagrei TaxID=38937 RepID=UPI003521EC3C